MHKSVCVLVFVAGLFLSGCVPSLHPLYTADDVVFRPALVGEWSESEDSQETWTFAASGGQAYSLVYVDENGKSGAFIAHLAEVEGKLFLDLYPEELEVDGNDFYKGHFIPAHTFLRVEQIEPTLRMAPLNAEWLRVFLGQHPDAVRHEQVEDGILLTAQPKELQAFLIGHLATEEAFGDLSNMTRREREAEG